MKGAFFVNYLFLLLRKGLQLNSMTIGAYKSVKFFMNIAQGHYIIFIHSLSTFFLPDFKARTAPYPLITQGKINDAN